MYCNEAMQRLKKSWPYSDVPKEENHLGYNIAHDGSLGAMAFSLGRKHEV